MKEERTRAKDTTQPHWKEDMRVRPVTGQVQYQVSELLGPALWELPLGPIQIQSLQNLIEAETLKFLRTSFCGVHKGLGQNSTKGN